MLVIEVAASHRRIWSLVRFCGAIVALAVTTACTEPNPAFVSTADDRATTTDSSPSRPDVATTDADANADADADGQLRPDRGTPLSDAASEGSWQAGPRDLGPMTDSRPAADAELPPATDAELPPVDGGRDGGAVLCNRSEVASGGRCYRVLSGLPMAFDRAEQACRYLGAQVVSIESTAVNQMVLAMLGPDVHAAWIGLRRGPNGFTWTDGTPVNYLNWTPGEPNNETGDEDCTVMWGSGISIAAWQGSWNDAPCNAPARAAVVCERIP